MTQPFKWVPVIKPGSAFDDRTQEVRMNDAQLDNPRREGESLVSWIERLNVAAGTMTLSQCEAIERDWREDDVNEIFGPARRPGEEG